MFRFVNIFVNVAAIFGMMYKSILTTRIETCEARIFAYYTLHVVPTSTKCDHLSVLGNCSRKTTYTESRESRRFQRVKHHQTIQSAGSGQHVASPRKSTSEAKHAWRGSGTNRGYRSDETRDDWTTRSHSQQNSQHRYQEIEPLLRTTIVN